MSNRSKIPATFRRNGFDYELLRAETRPNCPDVYAVYAQSKSGRVHAYESVRLRDRPEGYIRNRRIAGGPKLPSNESWGLDGFTHFTESAAVQRMKEMIRQDTERDARKAA